MLSANKRSIFAKIILFLCTIIWGSSFFILKNTLDEVPIYFLLTVRFLSSAVLMSLIFAKRYKHFNMKYLLIGGLAGIFLAFAYIFQTIGLQYTTPGTNAFLTTTYCLLVPFMMWIFTRKRPSIYNFIAALICIVGLSLVCLDGGGISFSVKGEGFTLICGIFFAAQMVVIGLYGEKLDIMLFTIFQFFTAGVVCLIFFFIFEKPPTSLSTGSMLSIVYVTVFATLICFIFMNVGIKYTSATSASLILSLESVFGIIFSMIFYKERITLQVGIGFAVIFIAILISETQFSFLHKKPKDNIASDDK